MQKNTMISVKDAAALLELDERSIRERLINGSLKGEKRNVGQREKWFVHAGSIEAELKEKRSAQNMAEMLKYPPTDNNANAINFSPEFQQQVMQQQYVQALQQPMAGAQGQQYVPQQQRMPLNAHGVPVQASTSIISQDPAISSAPVEGLAKVDTDISDTEEAIVDVQYSNDSKSTLEKERAMMKALAEEMMKPLIEKVEEQKSILVANERVIEEQKEQLRLLPDLQARKAELENKIDGERKAAEVNYAKAQALEEKLSERESEIIRIKAEKDTETRLIQEQLSKLTQKLDKLERPWWQKLFGAPADES